MSRFFFLSALTKSTVCKWMGCSLVRDLSSKSHRYHTAACFSLSPDFYSLLVQNPGKRPVHSERRWQFNTGGNEGIRWPFITLPHPCLTIHLEPLASPFALSISTSRQNPLTKGEMRDVSRRFKPLYFSCLIALNFIHTSAWHESYKNHEIHFNRLCSSNRYEIKGILVRLD